MAFLVEARKVAEDATSVRYEYRFSDRTGVVVIPLADPEAWFVEGSDGRPYAERQVAARAQRGYLRDGVWPVDASTYS